METFKDSVYKIKETLDAKKTLIPYFDNTPNNLETANPILGLQPKTGLISFAGNYPSLGSGKFTIWFTPEIPISVGPEEFFVKDLFILKAVSENKDLMIEAESIDFKNIDASTFEIPSEFSKEISMEEFHTIMGM